MNELKVRQEGFNLTPQNLDEAMKYAKLIADSDLAPKDYKGKPGNVIVAMQMGYELGLKPMQAIQNIAVINGRPSIWGDALLAIIMSHHDFEHVKEWQEGETAHCSIKRKNQELKTKSFSIADAKKAGLWGKQGPWSQYPDRMLQMRARGFCCRDAFPDALKGIHMAEEARDIPREIEAHEVKETHAQTANKQLGLDSDPPFNFEAAFSYCETLDQLKVEFSGFKKKYKDPQNLAAMLKAKDLRKSQLEAIEVKVEVEQTNDEWIADFNGEVNPPEKEDKELK